MGEEAAASKWEYTGLLGLGFAAAPPFRPASRDDPDLQCCTPKLISSVSCLFANVGNDPPDVADGIFDATIAITVGIIVRLEY